MGRTINERFWSHVSKISESGCWLWTGATVTGYGRFGVGRNRIVPAHRYAWELENGPIPEGKVLDHLCRQRACVNPRHLRVCTLAENLLAPGSLSPPKLNQNKTHCTHGHEFTPENTKYTRRGDRRCRTCAKIREHARTLPGGDRVSKHNTGKYQTHCKHGHKFTEETTRYYRGKRYCRTCQQRWQRERYEP